ncbi:hypothetical protein WSM22_04400 [Cytophagales bacterium WSM2-2]|nr:hypothetical protein WSM22_04400 [Cytophagales bacterium WSM2-2]
MQQCSDKCRIKKSYTYYEPVYSTSAEIKAATGMTEARPLISPGKLYLKDQILFINETGKGIHVFDNSNPASPGALSFLNIPGNYDLAILDNILYADSFVDLVMFDISNVADIKIVNRVEGLFKNYNAMGFVMDAAKGIVTEWKKVSKITIEENDCSPNQVQAWGGIYYDMGIAVPYSQSSAATLSATALAPSTGISGSLSRFALNDTDLYAIDGSTLATLNITNPIAPERKADQTLLIWPETLFLNGKNLFVGSRAGMAIYSIASPDQPTFISNLDHIYSCDPVVVLGDYAYVTLYNGGTCHNNVNELQVINIKDLTNPVLQKKYDMTNPHGLGIDQNLLFICDGSDGLKIFDASDPNTISSHQLAHYPGIDALDVIPYRNIAIMIGKDGLFQYDYSNLSNIRLLSKIEIVSQQ